VFAVFKIADSGSDFEDAIVGPALRPSAGGPLSLNEAGALAFLCGVVRVLAFAGVQYQFVTGALKAKDRSHQPIPKKSGR